MLEFGILANVSDVRVPGSQKNHLKESTALGFFVCLFVFWVIVDVVMFTLLPPS
jgi:hypothetical protein